MLFSIDRIINKTAVLIDDRGQPLEVPVRMLPPGAISGDMVEHRGKEFVYAPQKTAMRRETMANVLGQLLAHGDYVKQEVAVDIPANSAEKAEPENPDKTEANNGV